MRFLILGLCLFLGACDAEDIAKTKENPIKIGWIYSYTAMPYALELARYGAELAVAEFNAQKSVIRKVELLFRDDRGSAADGIQVAQDLVERDGVDILSGMSYTVVSKAIYEYAEKFKVPYFAGWCDSSICQKKEGYAFSFEPEYQETAHVLAQRAATYPIRKWAIIRNQDTWSIGISKPFIEKLQELRPDVELVAEVTAPFGGIEGGPTAQLLKGKGAEGVYITVPGRELSSYLRAQKQLGMLENYWHIHPYLPPEEIKPLGKILPENWYVVGYPEQALKTPENLNFIQEFTKKTGKTPGLVGAVAYSITKFMLKALQQSLTEEGMIDKNILLENIGKLNVETPLGLLKINPATNLSNLQQWYGELSVVDGTARLQNFKYGRD